MRSAIRLAALFMAWLTLGALGPGCAAGMRVRIDARHDISGLRTWNWLPPETHRIEVGSVEDPASLARRIEPLVAAALRGQGFVQVRGTADFYVTYGLRVERQLVTTWETGAEQQLSSLHSSPSFVVQASRPKVVPVETGRLVISAVDRRRREVAWRGEISHRVEGAFATHLADSVARVFETFPIASAGVPAAPRPSGPAPGWTLTKNLPVGPPL